MLGAITHSSICSQTPAFVKEVLNPERLLCTTHAFICWCSAEPLPPDNVVKRLKLCTGSSPFPPFLYNYPIEPALMTPLSFCPEASPHSVCKVRVPSLPQFDSVKAWKQIKACCFSQSQADTEPVRTRLTRGSFATCCFCLWWGLRNVGTSPCSPVFFGFFSPLCCFSSLSLFSEWFMRRTSGNMELLCSKLFVVPFLF